MVVGGRCFFSPVFLKWANGDETMNCKTLRITVTVLNIPFTHRTPKDSHQHRRWIWSVSQC